MYSSGKRTQPEIFRTQKIRVENLAKLKESGFDDYLLTTKLLDTDQLLKLDENNIKTRDQLADLSNSELIEIFRDMDQDKADEIYPRVRVRIKHIGHNCSPIIVSSHLR